MQLQVQWRIDRVVTIDDVKIVEYGEESISYRYVNVLDPDWQADNPETQPMLDDILNSMSAICERNGGFNA